MLRVALSKSKVRSADGALRSALGSDFDKTGVEHTVFFSVSGAVPTSVVKS